MIGFVRSRWIRYVLVAATFTLAAGSGLAFAAGGGGTLHGCVKKKSGALRLASSCKKSERAVSWNIVGPQGATGAAGAAGAAGPSDAWEANSPGATNVTSTAKVISVTVPAGSYDVTGKTQEQNRDATKGAALHCTLFADTTILDDMYSTALPWDNSVGGYGYGDTPNVVHAGFTTATGTTFSLSCAGSFAASVYVNNPTLSAIKVGTLH